MTHFTTNLKHLTSRYSIRSFKKDKPISVKLIRELIKEASSVPNSCNHQMWHFVIVQSPELKMKLVNVAGANKHIGTCNTAVVLCTQIGWNHSKFSVIQSLAAAAYQIIISAHNRGIASVWNAGIGNTAKISNILGIPNNFLVIGIIAMGYQHKNSSSIKPPRRDPDSIFSVDKFERPPETIYPQKRIPIGFKFESILNSKNKYSIFNPKEWGWQKIKDFRSFAIFATSPGPEAYISRTFKNEMNYELGFAKEGSSKTILEIMPYAGSYTRSILNNFDPNNLFQAELSVNNYIFLNERLKLEKKRINKRNQRLMKNGTIPFIKERFDFVFLPQIIESIPDYKSFLNECERVLNQKGRIILTFRNLLSWYGIWFFFKFRKRQVPNLGPFYPLISLFVIFHLSRRFRIRCIYGISPLPNMIGTPTYQKLIVPFCRIIYMELGKK